MRINKRTHHIAGRIPFARSTYHKIKKTNKPVAETQKKDPLPEFLFQHDGYCPCCETKVKFKSHDSWLRDNYICINCDCIPRERALMTVIDTYYPNWKNLKIHESSPAERGASITLRRNAKNYTASQYFPRSPRGSIVKGFRNEDLEKQTFKDDDFDLVITLDVMEHIYNPKKAFGEIARTLKKGGAYIFTVPIINKHDKTTVWAKKDKNGNPVFLHQPEYHGNPVDKNGSPVTMHWGYDIVDFIKDSSNMDARIISLYDKERGIMGEYNEVILAVKR